MPRPRRRERQRGMAVLSVGPDGGERSVRRAHSIDQLDHAAVAGGVFRIAEVDRSDRNLFDVLSVGGESAAVERRGHTLVSTSRATAYQAGRTRNAPATVVPYTALAPDDGRPQRALRVVYRLSAGVPTKATSSTKAMPPHCVAVQSEFLHQRGATAPG